MNKNQDINFYINLSEVAPKYTQLSNTKLSKREREIGLIILNDLKLDVEENENLEITCTTVELGNFIINILRNS
jgi:hypothetical protein